MLEPMTTTTALLVIDVQESFHQRPDDWQAMTNPHLLERVGRLIEAARAAGELVVWVQHTEPGSGGVFDPDSGFVRPIEPLAPIAGEPVVRKTSINAFTTTNLHQLLTARGIRDIVVCGIRTEQCCETTARVASDLGYDVRFVTDATSTSGIAADGALAAVSGEQIVSRTESILAAREFATIVTTDEVVAAAGVPA
jgi:nicotinamidase-related amidase